MYQLQVLEKARDDMQNSVDWYNKQQNGVGERFLLEVIRTFNLIESNPLHYRERFSKRFRFAPITDFPYVIVFKIMKQAVIVNSVFHTSRNPKSFFSDYFL